MVERRVPFRQRNFAHALAWASTSIERDPDFNPFAAYPPPPGVVPKSYRRPKLAMDQWPGGGAGNGFSGYGGYGANWNQTYALISQGYTFLGYPLLSELTSIPEIRVISETIAEEMTRKWIEFKVQGDDPAKANKQKAKKVKLIEDEMRRLRVQDRFAKLAEYDGFMGRAHLYLDIGTDPSDREELLTPIGDGRNECSKNKVSPENPLRALRVIEPIWTYPANYNANNPLRDDWYNPTTWFVMAMEIHVSRCLRFVGREVPDLLKPSFSFGGLAMSQMVLPYVNIWLRNRQSVSDIIHSFSVMVLGTGLDQSMQQDGNEFYQRMQFFTQARDNKGLMVIDKNSESLENVAAPLGTLDALLAQTQEHMAAVSRIPLVKLLGISPAGLNASSEGELRAFDQTIASFQESFFRPHLTTVIDFIQLSLFGKCDPDITFDFMPLYSLDELQLATKKKTEADTHQVYLDAGVVDQQEVRRAIAADKDTPYQGLDVDKIPEPPAESMPENEMGEPVGAKKILQQPDEAEQDAPDEDQKEAA